MLNFFSKPSAAQTQPAAQQQQPPRKENVKVPLRPHPLLNQAAKAPASQGTLASDFLDRLLPSAFAMTRPPTTLPTSVATIDTKFLNTLLAVHCSHKTPNPQKRASALATTLNIPKNVPLDLCLMINGSIYEHPIAIMEIALSRMSIKGQNASLENIAGALRFFKKPDSSSWTDYLTELSTSFSPLAMLQSGRQDLIVAGIMSQKIPGRLAYLLYPKLPIWKDGFFYSFYDEHGRSPLSSRRDYERSFTVITDVLTQPDATSFQIFGTIQQDATHRAHFNITFKPSDRVFNLPEWTDSGSVYQYKYTFGFPFSNYTPQWTHVSTSGWCQLPPSAEGEALEQNEA